MLREHSFSPGFWPLVHGVWDEMLFWGWPVVYPALADSRGRRVRCLLNASGWCRGWGNQAFHLSSCWQSPNERSLRESTDTSSSALPRLQVMTMGNVLDGLAISTVLLQHSQLGGFISWGFFSLFYLHFFLNSKFQSTISSFFFKICMQVHVFPRFQCLSEL